MAKENNEVETIVFQALSHPMRRTIITLLETKPALYTELITELGLPTGKMNYHLEQLEGLIEKNPEHRYELTPLGKKALNQLRHLKNEVTQEDQKYLAAAQRSQRSSLEPAVRSFLMIGIAGGFFVLAISAFLAYIVLTEGGAPFPVVLILPFGMAVEVAIVVTLVRALRNAPDWLRRLEKRFL